MPSISEFINSDCLEDFIVNNSSKYKNKFKKIIQKAKVDDSEISDKKAIEKIQKTISWNWSAFLFSSFWAIYRKQKLGWVALFLTIICIIVPDFISSPAIEKAMNTVPMSMSVLFGFYGNSYLLKNTIYAFSKNLSKKDQRQKDLKGLIIAIILMVTSFAAIEFLFEYIF